MRILSWNILHGGGVRREGILRAIEAIDPDLLTLQEVRRGDGPRSEEHTSETPVTQ